MRYSNAMYREVFPEVKQVTVKPTIESAVDTFRPSEENAIEKSVTAEQVQEIDPETVVEPSEGVADGSNSNGSDNATD